MSRPAPKSTKSRLSAPFLPVNFVSQTVHRKLGGVDRILRATLEALRSLCSRNPLKNLQLRNRPGTTPIVNCSILIGLRTLV